MTPDNPWFVLKQNNQFTSSNEKQHNAQYLPVIFKSTIYYSNRDTETTPARPNGEALKSCC